MMRFTGAILGCVLILGSFQSVSARPEFLSKYQSDPFRKPEIDGCVACHVNPRGGGIRNDFGQAFSATNHEITPMLRANFPDQFKYDTVKLPNGSMFYFSDPESKSVVYEREKVKTTIDLTTLSAVKVDKVEPLPVPENRMGFFVTSKGPGNGGHFEGLAGADRVCQNLAVAAGAGDRTWRAYLSTSFQDKPAINAGDRIGSGPWYNAKGLLVARGPTDLHSNGRLSAENILTEKGQPIGQAGSAALGILTGSLPNGTAAVGMNCNNWTSSEEGKAMAGGGGSWNSGRTVNGCSQKAFQEAGIQGLVYCFAAK